MKIQTITVEAHEKRAHPHEMGHYDSRVALTAEVQPGDDYEGVALTLQVRARAMVLTECDTWIRAIEYERKVDAARNSLGYILNRAEHGAPDNEDANRFEEKLQLLPEPEQAEYRTKYAAAQIKGKEYIERRLNRLVEGVTRGRLGWDDEDSFGELLERLPDDEATAWEAKMAAAKAAYEARQVPQVHSNDD